MTDAPQAAKTEPAGLINTAVNILVSPSEAFTELQQRPRKLFPLALLLLGSITVMLWYFSVMDFDWYIDDLLTTTNVDADDLEEAREQMSSMGKNTFMVLGILAATVTILLFQVIQAGYLALISALTGDGQKFSNWFSLVLWTALPSLFAIAGTIVTILLSTNGQLSSYDLNPLTLGNLGMESSNSSLTTLLNSVDVTMAWSIGLLVMGYKQWLETSLRKALTIVLSPYLLILVVWMYFALIG